MTINYDQPSDPSPRSIYDEDPRVCDPAEKFAQDSAARMDRIVRMVLRYREDVAGLRAEVKRLREENAALERKIRVVADDLAAYAAMEGN